MAILLIISAGLAVLDWVAVARGVKGLEYVAKPGTMVFLLAWLLARAGLMPTLVWFELALVFSLAGDVLLMLPRESFLGGLVAFLVAHLFFIVGFNQEPLPIKLVSLPLVILVFLAAAWLFVRVRAGLLRSGNRSLVMPVFAYTLVISVMVLSALATLTRPEWQIQPALLASVGAALFFASDGQLAWNRFVGPLRQADLRVMVTYHLAQFAILFAACWHFLGTPL
ncbi:MAG: lysoplasmalogenase [Anaerolineales bacterium]|jgi:uncharacterized membrane protein YhhN